MRLRVDLLVALGVCINATIVPTEAETIYWVDESGARIQKSDLDGSNNETVVQRFLFSPVEIDVDPFAEKLYWTDTNYYTGDSWIARANIDGSNIEFLRPTGLEYPYGIATDPVGQKIYWSQPSSQPPSICRANSDGSNAEKLVTGLAALGIALDLVNEKIYWASTSIMRASLDGTSVETLLVPDEAAHGIALDVASGKMYWTEGYLFSGFSSRVKRANLEGTDVETLVVGGGGPQGISLDLTHGKMYWADNSGSGLDPILARRANLDGTDVENLAAGLPPYGVAVDESTASVYWIGSHITSNARITRYHINDNSISLVLENELNLPCGVAVDSWDGRVYWSDQYPSAPSPRLRRAFNDGTGIEDVYYDPVAYGRVCGLSVDPLGRKVYWSDGAAEEINRSNLDGSEVETIANMGFGAFPSRGVTVDPAGGRLFWSQHHSSSAFPTYSQIRRANLNGSELVQILSTTSSPVVGSTALDPLHGRLYFTRCCEPRRIQRCDLNGKNIEDVVTFTSGGAGGLAFHPIERKLYWSSTISTGTDGGVIRRCNPDGTEIEDVFAGIPPTSAIALELAPHLIGSNPPPCTIDARQPFAPDAPDIALGLQWIDVFLSVPETALAVEALFVEEWGGDGIPPEIAGVVPVAWGSFRVILSTPISPGAWTCIGHGSSGTKACIGYLPGDVNNDGYSGPADVLSLIDSLNNIQVPRLETWQTDIDRSGDSNAADVLRLVDLLGGAGTFDSWNGRDLTECP